MLTAGVLVAAGFVGSVLMLAHERARILSARAFVIEEYAAEFLADQPAPPA